MLQKRNYEQYIAPNNDYSFQFVPNAVSHVVTESYHSHPEVKIKTDGNIEKQFHAYKSRGVRNFETINDCNDEQKTSNDKYANIEILTFWRVVNLLQNHIQFALFRI